MAQSEIHADPKRLEALAQNLRMFSISLSAELTRLDSGMRNLGNTWRDDEYQKFKRHFERLKTRLDQLSDDIAKREPELQADARLLIAYLNKTL